MARCVVDAFKSGKSFESHSSVSVTISEIEEAMKELESEGIVQVFDRSMSVLIR